jgi:hypothetical protein
MKTASGMRTDAVTCVVVTRHFAGSPLPSTSSGTAPELRDRIRRLREAGYDEVVV